MFINDLKTHALHAKTCMEFIPANVSGVVFSFSRWLEYACEIGMETKERNNHAITKAYLIGLNSMYAPISDFDYSEITETLTKIME